MNHIPVCKLCLEPISNFVCPGCLYRSVQQWLWKSKPSLIESFRNFHREFTETLVSYRTAVCVSCKKEYYHMVCPYDYIKEIYSWLEDLLSKKALKEFLIIFSLGFKKIEIKRRHFYRNGKPSHHTREILDIGICENCENFSDDLKRDSSNRLVCEMCRQYGIY